MANKSNHPRRAVWRDFTEEQIKALPPTREEAFEADSIYYSGEPCFRNHIAVKYTESRNCVICNADKYKRRYYKNKSRSKKAVKKSKTITVMGINFNELLSKNKE